MAHPALRKMMIDDSGDHILMSSRRGTLYCCIVTLQLV